MNLKFGIRQSHSISEIAISHACPAGLKRLRYEGVENYIFLIERVKAQCCHVLGIKWLIRRSLKYNKNRPRSPHFTVRLVNWWTDDVDD